MKQRNKIFISIAVGIAAYFCALFPLRLLYPEAGKMATHSISLFTACLYIALIWLFTRKSGNEIIVKIILIGIVIGAVGFIIGFIGPLVISPEANQGPLLGIFITGPLSFLGGILAGLFYWYYKSNR